MLRCDVQLNSRQYSWSQIRVQNRWRCRAVVQSAATSTCRCCKVILPVLVDVAECCHQYLSTLQGDTTSTCRRRVLLPVLVDVAGWYNQYLSTLQGAATSTCRCRVLLPVLVDVAECCRQYRRLQQYWRRTFWLLSTVNKRRYTALLTWKCVFTVNRMVETLL